MEIPFSLDMELIQLASQLTPERRGELGRELYQWLTDKVPHPEIARRIDELTEPEAAFLHISIDLLDQVQDAVKAFGMLGSVLAGPNAAGPIPPRVQIRPAVNVRLDAIAVKLARSIRPERRAAMVEKLVETSNIEPEDEAEKALSNWVYTLPEYEAAFIYLLLDVTGQLSDSGEFSEDEIAPTALTIVEGQIGN